MDFGLTGKVAIVTGASHGLGSEAVRALAGEGVCVVASARDGAALDELAAALGSRVTTVVCDIADPDAAQHIVDEAIARHDRLDIVVNNAGIAPVSKLIDQDWSVWDRIFAVNVTGPARLCQAAMRHFSSDRGGKVINMASTAGIAGKATLSGYSASKGALIALTQALAAEWASSGVQVNAIAPGAFSTAAQSRVTSDPELYARRIRKIPARRMADATEIGPLVCYLASPLSNFVTGAVYVIDGGEIAAQ
jgi:2-dehydro-3-deoxy-D-gluconate 5-dehydrogenase